MMTMATLPGMTVMDWVAAAAAALRFRVGRRIRCRSIRVFISNVDPVAVDLVIMASRWCRHHRRRPWL
jgi:hypothetical protein